MDFKKCLEEEDFGKIEILLKNGHDASKTFNDKGNQWKPLEWMVFKSNLKIAQLLISYKANVDGITTQTALYGSASNNNIPMMKLLLSNNAKPNIECDFKQTALHSASKNSSLEAVELLLTLPDIDCLALDINGKSAFDLAGNEMIKKMIKMKANEQENKKFALDLHALKVSKLKKNIAEKEKEIAYLSSKCVELSEKIALMMDELESTKIKYPLAIDELADLKTQRVRLTSVVKPAFSIVEDENLECPCCFTVPMAPVVIYQCDNGHIVCSTCAEHMSKCPQCRISLDRKTRARQMEKIIATKKCLTNK